MDSYVAFSGGIDSTALALSMPKATPVFTDTGWEFDEIYAHLDKFQEVTGREVIRIVSHEGTLPDYIRRHKFMPGHRARFCTRIFKIEPMDNWLKLHLPAELCIGLRADESAEDRVERLSDIEGLTIRYPLREMGINRVGCINICLKHDLLPRYPVYMARGGCKGCFYKRKSEVKAMAQLVPDVLEELRELEEDVQDERGQFALMFDSAGLKIRDIQAQPSLFDMTELYRDAADNSDKGQACGLFCHR